MLPRVAGTRRGPAPTTLSPRSSETTRRVTPAATMLVTQRGTPNKPATSASRTKYAQGTSPTPPLIASGATTFGRRFPFAAGPSNATSGATRTASVIVGASGAPVKTRAATRARTTGDVDTAMAAAPAWPDSTSADARRTTITSRIAASGAARAAYHQSNPTPASLRAPGFPGTGSRMIAPVRRPSRPAIPTRRGAAIDIT